MLFCTLQMFFAPHSLKKPTFLRKTRVAESSCCLLHFGHAPLKFVLQLTSARVRLEFFGKFKIEKQHNLQNSIVTKCLAQRQSSRNHQNFVINYFKAGCPGGVILNASLHQICQNSARCSFQVRRKGRRAKRPQKRLSRSAPAGEWQSFF